MNRNHEFRRLRWLLKVQSLLQLEKHRIMSRRLASLNFEEPALEFNKNELARLLEVELKITSLSYEYDFDREPSDHEIKQYLLDMLGTRIESKDAQTPNNS